MPDNVIDFPDWRRQLQKRKNGDPYANELNACSAFELAPELRGLLRYDEFRDVITLMRPFNEFGKAGESVIDAHITHITTWIQNAIPGMRPDIIHRALVLAARRNSIHPVREYLQGLTWDGTPRLTNWLHVYLGSREDQAYLAGIGPKFLIGAAARILQPGCQMDTILVLEGSQGIGKSTAVRTLARCWSADVTGDLTTKDAAIHIQGIWIGEMAELTSIRRSDVETVKGFISRRIDRYRPPYGRNSQERPRQTVFIATTNDNEYLTDSTGARRFWPTECTKIDIAALERDADQLWAEAVHRFQAGERWHLDARETVRAQREQVVRQRTTIVDDEVLEYADRQLASGIRRIEMRELLQIVFDINTRESPGQAGQVGAQAARALTREGWVRQKPVGRGVKRRQYYEWIDAIEEPDVPEPAENSQGSQGSQAEMAYDQDIPF